jgi:micrococcal nuclease
VGRRTWFVLLLAVLLLAALVVALLVLWKPSREQSIACTNYDSQIWAQSVYDTNPTQYATLDPDGNDLACEELPHGVAPALWTNEVPEGAEPAALVSISDGDTIRVDFGGQIETVRLILIDTPETRDPNNPPECYGSEASAFLEGLLPAGSELYLETDVSERDRFGRLLRYVWLDRGDEVYLVNEAMVRSGYAAQSTFPPDVEYEDRILEAARFAREHGYGLWSACQTDAEGDTNELGKGRPNRPRLSRSHRSHRRPGPNRKRSMTRLGAPPAVTPPTPISASHRRRQTLIAATSMTRTALPPAPAG